MRKTALLLPLKLIIGKNFKMKDLKDFVKNLVSSTIFQLQELHNKMDLWRGKIEPWKNLQELY